MQATLNESHSSWTEVETWVSCENALSSAFKCVRHVCTFFVCSHRARGCHRDNKWVSKCGKKAAGEDGRVSVPLVGFFSSAFSNLLVDWYSSCWSVSSCCVYVHICAVEKKNRRKNVLVENDTWKRKQKANKKNSPCRSSKKMFSPLHPYTHRTQRLVWVPWCDSRNRLFGLGALVWQPQPSFSISDRSRQEKALL